MDYSQRGGAIESEPVPLLAPGPLVRSAKLPGSAFPYQSEPKRAASIFRPCFTQHAQSSLFCTTKLTRSSARPVADEKPFGIEFKAPAPGCTCRSKSC